MFRLGKESKDPLADAKSAARWLASLPANDPLAVERNVLVELARPCERTARRTPQGLEAVFRIDAGTKGVRETLVEQYLEHANRSSKIENQIWQALFDLSQGFLACYAAFAREASHHAQSNKWQGLLAELLARQIMHHGLDAKVRLFRYEQWIPARWAELHAHFALACSRQIERRPLLADADGDTTTVEHEYLVALVLQLVNSGNLTPKHLDWVAGHLNDWCKTLRLTPEPSTVTSFYVDLGSRMGLRRRTPAPLEGHVLFLDTSPLHALLRQNVAVLEQMIQGQALSEKTARRNEQLALVSKLAAQVDPEFKPFARRGERTSAAGTVDAIVGFAKIAGYLHEDVRRPAPVEDAAKNFESTMELAVFGRSRHEPDRKALQVQRRLENYAAHGGPWEVKDVSQTGFRLLAPMSVAHAVTLGTLAAIRPRGQAVWALGIVRRMRRLTSDRAEIGLQIIANTISSVDLIEQHRPSGDLPSAGGEATTINGRSIQSLFLSLRKRGSDSPIQSLIMPAVDYQPARRFKLQSPTSLHAIRLGRLLERQPDWVWTAVEPFDRPVTAAASDAKRS